MKTAERRIIAIGDSHALAYGPMLARYAAETGSDVRIYNNGGCPLLSLQPEREKTEYCQASIAATMADVLPRLTQGDIVFLPSLRLPRYVEQGWVSSDATVVASVHGDAAQRQRDHAVMSARDMLLRLRKTGAHVVLQAPNLIVKAPPFRCADSWTRSNPICARGTAIARNEFEFLRAPVVAALTQLADADDGVTLFDPFPVLCRGATTCDAFRHGRPLLFDGDHLSAYGNQVVYPAFLESMASIETSISNETQKQPSDR